MPPNYNQPVVPVQLPKKHINGLLFPFIFCLLILIAVICFGFWAFVSREDFKKNSDRKAAAAVVAAEKVLDAEKEAEFKEREKEPLKTYTGSATLGSVVIKYPKTWSGYILETGRGSSPLEGYLHPNFVPATNSDTAFALHFEIVNDSYDEVLKDYDSEVSKGDVTVEPVKAPKVAGVTGSRIEGLVERDKQGVTVLFPVRDKTLKITTESRDFVKDFDKIILANLTFVP